MAALSSDGKVFTAGKGNHGQLGHGNRESTETLTLVESLCDHHIVNVQCGINITIALTDKGEVYAW